MRNDKLTRIKNKTRYFFRYTLTKPFRCLFNVFYFMRYPFLQPRNVWTEEKYWDFNVFSSIPRGWRKAFGKQLRDDLRKALIKDGILKTFYFTQIKEKYGELCLYNTGEGPETSKVIRHYEDLSVCYCINCGKPARYVTEDWIEYLCEDCFESNFKHNDDYEEYEKECRLTEKDIPHYYRFEDGERVEIDNGIDYRTLWGIEDREIDLVGYVATDEGLKKE